MTRLPRFLPQVIVSLSLLLAGCQPTAPSPPTPPISDEPQPGPGIVDRPADSTQAAAVDPETSGESSEPPRPVVAYSQEQIATARQLAKDLGVLIREDDQGNVVLIDTAANRSWVDDDQMQQLLVFPTLQTLTVEGPSITEHLAPRIAEARQLSSLAMRNTLVNDQGIEQFRDLQGLRIIDLRLSALLTDAAMETLSTISSLRAVRLSGVNLTDAGLARLLELPHLTELDLRNCRRISKEGIAQIGKKRSIRVLKLGGPEIDDQVLELVAEMDQLTGLSLDLCDITDAGIRRLTNLPLDDLTIFQCVNITDEGLDVLAHYDRLRRLTLRDVSATGAALQFLPNPEALVTLNLEQSRFSDAQTPLLPRFTGLETLILSQTDLTDDAIDSLQALTWLNDLMLTQTRITDQGVQRLREALPGVSIRLH
jgi:internalin A